MKHLLKTGERIDQLYASDIQIIQSKDVFSFSLDAVLLADFARVPRRGRVVDLCAGNGAVGLFVSKKTEAEIIGIELQEKLADMAQRSVQLNHLEHQVVMHNLDVAETFSVVPHDSADMVVCNPPYFKHLPANKTNPNDYLAVARHEIHTNLADILTISAGLLKMNGKLAMVHRPDRFLDILDEMRRVNVMPKRCRFVYPKKDREANILLIEGIKHGKQDGFKVLPPLVVYDEDNQYLPEVRKMLYGS